MTKYFTTGTPLIKMEVIMMSPPNVSNRCVGENYSCRDCLYYSRKKGCNCSHCPYIEERLEGGFLDYKGLLEETFDQKFSLANKLKERIALLAKNNTGDRFVSNHHRSLFYSVLEHRKRMDGVLDHSYVAALYLLTANRKLWEQVSEHVFAKKIYFEDIKIGNLDTKCYIYYQMAKMLSDNIPRISTAELSDKKLIKDEVFKTLIHGTLIKLYGIKVFTL